MTDSVREIEIIKTKIAVSMVLFFYSIMLYADTKCGLVAIGIFVAFAMIGRYPEYLRDIQAYMHGGAKEEHF